MLLVEQTSHLRADDERIAAGASWRSPSRGGPAAPPARLRRRSRPDRGRRRRLPCRSRQDRQPDVPVLDVQDRIGGAALSIDHRLWLKGEGSCPRPGRVQKRLLRQTLARSSYSSPLVQSIRKPRLRRGCRFARQTRCWPRSGTLVSPRHHSGDVVDDVTLPCPSLIVPDGTARRSWGWDRTRQTGSSGRCHGGRGLRPLRWSMK